jgi:hypothetical protein
MIAPPILMGVMYPIFQLLAGALGQLIGWYLGLVTYWLIWGGLFPWLVIGKEGILRMIRPQRPSLRVILLVLFPILMAGAYRVISGMAYEKSSGWAFLLILSTNLGNGFFEEVLWRGVYMELFPGSSLFRIVWPTIWFALWHYAPGSVSPSGNALGLMIGSGMMGLYLSLLAKHTVTIWWNIVAHALGGFIMIV